MEPSDLDYELPRDRIAQQPLPARDAARLLLVERSGASLEEIRFGDLGERLGADDLLVVNDTRVIPARLRGRKKTGGAAEALLWTRFPDGSWRALVRARGRLRAGLELCFGDACAQVTRVHPDGSCTMRFEPPDLDPLRLGEAPLPPYIRRDEPLEADLESYQSVFARVSGAVAAPTASLHFSREMAARLRIARVTLHVGPGTFRPLSSAPLEEQRLEPELFRVPAETARAIREAKARGGQLIATGTTVVRALETTGGEAGGGRTRLFILPGYRFRVVDSLITNFHLPRSSLLALTMAFAGRDVIREAYRHAIESGFRFYSYGDAMWIR
ncbi:MAG: tRNA preQ1(34) S-adenosylmethionine ribosyltransferase-isomerase QueA [Myxococcota bacterium]